VKRYSIKNLSSEFGDDAACLAFIFSILYSYDCNCGGSFQKVSGRRTYQCSRCRAQVAPAAHTCFHGSRTPLSSWFYVIWLFYGHKGRVHASEIRDQLGITYKCAWRMRQALEDTGIFKKKGVFQNDFKDLLREIIQIKPK